VNTRIDLADSDAALAAAVGDVLATPRRDSADSFVLHAPLELLARTALLPFVQASFRADARDRIAEIATQFEAFGSPVSPPATVTPSSVSEATRILRNALDRGELDQVDALASWLGRHVEARDLTPLLADAVIPRLAAAAHAPIFLWLYPRVSPRGEVPAEMLRQVCRELARAPDWRIEWIEQRAPADPASGERLFDALADAPRLGPSASNFIYPLMSRVDSADLAGAILGPVTSGSDVRDRARAVQHVAAWSMLTEPTDAAPYGWSHCLTMPQAVLETAWACVDPSSALAVAATFVLGFRASQSNVRIDRTIGSTWQDPRCSVGDAIRVGAATARAAMWHTTPENRRTAVGELATFAATHHDAHLVKYTLACLDAAARDPGMAGLYLSAAATLAGWWSEHPDGIPIG
jgi:hypothetical protein